MMKRGLFSLLALGFAAPLLIGALPRVFAQQGREKQPGPR
jgi:hypothetical protein